MNSSTSESLFTWKVNYPSQGFKIMALLYQALYMRNHTKDDLTGANNFLS